MTQTLRVRLLDNFGKAFLPRRWRLSLRAHFLKAGILEVPYHLIGLGFHLTTLLTLALFLLIRRTAMIKLAMLVSRSSPFVRTPSSANPEVVFQELIRMSYSPS